MSLSTYGWMISAPTCSNGARTIVPVRDNVGELSGEHERAHWYTTAGVSWTGRQDPGNTAHPQRRHKVTVPLADAPTPDYDRFEVTSRVMHVDPGKTAYKKIRKDMNAPSEPDHPLLGLLHPERQRKLVELQTTYGTYESKHAYDFKAPHRSAYAPIRSGDPFAPSLPRDATY